MTFRPLGRNADARRIRIALLNPNTDEAVTATMVSAARVCQPPGVEVVGRTVASGVPMITNEAALAEAVPSVVVAGKALSGEGFDGVIVAAFGDPGLAELRATVSLSVVGIAESGMAEAAEGGRRFSVVTVTPDLIASIREAANRYCYGKQLASVLTTPGDPRSLVSDKPRLEKALLTLSQRAIEDDGAEAIVVGGGPLAPAAQVVARTLSIPVIEPVCAAVRRIVRLLREA